MPTAIRNVHNIKNTVFTCTFRNVNETNISEFKNIIHERIANIKIGDENVKLSNYITFINENKLIIFVSFRRENISKRDNAIKSIYEDLESMYNCTITFQTYGRIEFFELFMDFLMRLKIEFFELFMDFLMRLKIDELKKQTPGLEILEIFQ
jgi:hypothetical protein